jgi:hypothetical protein
MISTKIGIIAEVDKFKKSNPLLFTPKRLCSENDKGRPFQTASVVFHEKPITS